MYTGARLPWGSLNQNAGWLGEVPARGVSRIATTGRKPLPWGTINPGGYLGADPVDWTAVIQSGLSTVGSIFGGKQNQAATPGSSVSFPVAYQAQPAGMFGGISTPVVLGVAALAAVLLLKRR